MVALPAKVSGGYWQNWGKPNVALRDVPSGYNVVLIAFAYGDSSQGGGLVLDLPAFQSASALLSDIGALHGQGRAVLLSIGGADDQGIHLTTQTHVAQMVSSLNALVTKFGFDGIDWDLENTANINVVSMLAVSQALKRQWGSAFAITINSAPSEPLYKQLAGALNKAGQLDLICHMFYDYSTSESSWLNGVTSRVTELISGYGIPPSKIGIGVKNVATAGSTADTSSTTTVATTLAAWKTLLGRYPDLRGIYVWSLNLDQSVGYPYLAQVAPAVIGTVTPPPPPPWVPPGLPNKLPVDATLAQTVTAVNQLIDFLA